MIEIKGEYATAIVYADDIEPAASGQILALCNQPYTKESKIRIMPDVHAGKGCVIGTTMTVTDAICPNMVGVDIGCGMLTTKLRAKRIDFNKLDKLIRAEVPSGFHVHTKVPHKYAYHMDSEFEALKCARHVKIDHARMSIGTLGGGNHFIEVAQDEEGDLYLIIHTGSRHLGLEVATYYQNKACGSPHELACVTGQDLEDYLHDLETARHMAVLNRYAICETICYGMKWKYNIGDDFTTEHNYIGLDSYDNMVLRKGAVSARKNEKLLIPLNMRDGSLLCVGKGNSDWNCSAPHGAGRLMSRTKARGSFTLTQFKAAMAGIHTTCVSSDTLDESPMAYKPAEDIIRNMQDTVEVLEVLKPVYNFKAGGRA